MPWGYVFFGIGLACVSAPGVQLALMADAAKRQERADRRVAPVTPVAQEAGGADPGPSARRQAAERWRDSHPVLQSEAALRRHRRRQP